MGDRRLWLAAAGVAVLLVAAVVALVVGGGDDDEMSVASRSTTSTSPAPSSSSAPATSVAGTAGPAASPTSAGRGSVATTTAAPATTAPAGNGPRSCAPPGPGSDFAGFGATEIVIENAQGPHRSCVLTADTPAQQQRGLMAQDDLDGYAGMIFRYADERPRSFWMRNTRIPLSIAYFDSRGAFVSAHDMEPCGDRPDCPGYPSGGPAQFALEVVQGRLPAAGATPDSRLAV